MKKKILSLLALLTIVCTAGAQNALTAEAVVVPQNAEGELIINYQFDQEGLYAGYQFEIALPEGIIAVTNEKGNVVVTKGEAHEESHSVSTNYDTEANVVKIACFSSEGDILLGQSGNLLSIGLLVTGELEVGQTLTGTIQGVSLSTEAAVSVQVGSSTFSIIVGEPDDGRIKFNETSTTLPKYTAGDKGNVRMVRTIKAGQWSTIVLPFTLTKAKAETAFGSDVELAEFSGFEVDYGDDEDNVIPLGITINFATYGMSAKKGMTGGKPFLIKTSRDIASFEADEVSLVSAVTNVSKTDDYDTSGKFTGSLVKTVIPADGLFLYNNMFYYSTGKTNIKAFRAWLELGAVLNKETDFEAKVRFVIDGVPTDIEGVTANEYNQEDAVYSLNGVLMGKAAQLKQLPKGMYIVNRKKVIVK